MLIPGIGKETTWPVFTGENVIMAIPLATREFI
jgi:hypothetical protein